MITSCLPIEVSNHIERAARLAQDISQPPREMAPTSYYSTPCFYHYPTYNPFPRTVHHVHHTSSAPLSSTNTSNKEKNDSNAMLIGVIFAVVGTVFTFSFANNLGVLSRARADLRKFEEDVEVSQWSLKAHLSAPSSLTYHPNKEAILNQLNRIYTVEKSILTSYADEAKTSLTFKGLILSGSIAASYGAFFTLSNVMWGGGILACGGAFVWALLSAYQSGAQNVKSQAEELASEIKTLNYML